MTTFGNRSYHIKYTRSVEKDDIPALPKTMKLRIKKAIDERLTTDPVNLGKPLKYTFRGRYRLRVGDYRIMYTIDQSNSIVTIIAIRHRREAYDDQGDC